MPVAVPDLFPRCCVVSPEIPLPVRRTLEGMLPRQAVFCAPRDGPRSLLRCILCETIIAVAAPWRVDGLVMESKCRSCNRPALGRET